MKKILLNLFCFYSLFYSLPAIAVADISVIHDLKGDDDFNDSDYYQIKDDPRLQYVNLLYFLHQEEALPKPAEAYNRQKHFGTWIVSHDAGCLNTRAQVLVRDSIKPVTYSSNGCTVASGDWNDPYSKKEFSSAKDIQIDHFVPLKNAYMTGAFEWEPKKRCLYANYLGNSFHLLAVSGVENDRKGDGTPSTYVPPNSLYVCRYLKQWLEIKMIWSLRLTPKEVSGLKAKVEAASCPADQFVIPYSEISDQRRYMETHADYCQ